jgi:hypothetical protein
MRQERLKKSQRVYNTLIIKVFCFIYEYFGKGVSADFKVSNLFANQFWLEKNFIAISFYNKIFYQYFLCDEYKSRAFENY